MEWYDLVTEVQEGIQHHVDIISPGSLQVTLDKASNLIDTSRFGIEQACNILRKDFKAALEGFLEEGLENVPPEYFEKVFQISQKQYRTNQ